MRMKTIAAFAASGVLAVGLIAAPPAAAAEHRPRTTTSPGLAYVRLAEGPAPAGPAGNDGPTAWARTDGSTVQASASFVPPPNEDFVFHYAPDVSESKQAAFEAAGGIWSDVLEIEVPIDVGVSVESFSDPGILGGAAPADLLANDPAFPSAGTWYVSALANQFLRTDHDPDRVEIDVLISADYRFHEEVGGPVPGDRISLLTLALHELGHGLGHTTLARRLPDGTGTIRHEGLPLAFDLLVQNSSRVPLVALGPSALGSALTQRLVWGGSEGIAADGGLLPELFAPRLFQPGSSVSHLDEATYQSGLMTPYIANGELHTSVPPLTRAMMADSGWGVEARTPAEAFVTAASRDFVRRFPTPTQLRQLAGQLDSGRLTRAQLVAAYGTSDAWIGAAVDGYYLTTLGRAPDPTGRRYWIEELRSGTPSAEVAAQFFASTEYFRRSGGTNQAWIRALYLGILGREPDPAGWAAWVEAADNGNPRVGIATTFYQAPESRAKRVRELYLALLGRQPDADGLRTWTDVLRNGRDIELAIRLASSAEYEDRSVRRFG